jgi:hypothetical protein
VSTDVRNIPTVIVDHDRSPASRSLADRITSSGYFTITRTSDRSVAMDRALDERDAMVALEIPPGYSEDIASGVARRCRSWSTAPIRIPATSR